MKRGAIDITKNEKLVEEEAAGIVKLHYKQI